MSATRLALTTGCLISRPRTPAQRSSRHLARRCKNLLRRRRRSLPLLLPDEISSPLLRLRVLNVRFGVTADMASRLGSVGFTPESGQTAEVSGYPLYANSDRTQRSKTPCRV